MLFLQMMPTGKEDTQVAEVLSEISLQLTMPLLATSLLNSCRRRAAKEEVEKFADEP